jgi:predicted dehydrogenase
VTIVNARHGGTRKLRFGIIGTGRFAEACHVPGLQSHLQAEVVALCGRRYDQTRAMADRLGIPDVHIDHREVCARADLDAVTIATPNVYHADQAITALRCGKHVFCEKPLAMTVAEAQDMARVAEQSGNVHMVSFTYRYLHGIQHLRRRVREGDIGEPYYIRAQYDSWEGLAPNFTVGFREKLGLAGGGMLYDVGSHLLDLACFILGPIEALAGFSHSIPRQRPDSRTGQPADVETDDMTAAWFRHENGIRGQVFMSRATPAVTDKSYLEVIGPQGALRASLSRGSVDVLKVSRPTKPAWEELPLPDEARDGKPHCLGIMMRSFVDACSRGKLNGDTDASFHDGLAAQQCIAALTEATNRPAWPRLGAHVDR